MHLRCVPIRPLKSKKILLLSLVFGTFLFYIKFITNNSVNVEHESGAYQYGNNNRKLIAGKLVNEYNGDSNVVELPAVNDGQSIDRRSVPASENAPAQQQPPPPPPAKYNEMYEKWINADIAKQEHGLGDNGLAATLSDPAAKEIGERQLKKIALNEELSEHLSYNRTLQDARNPLCRTQHANLNELPTTSIIIIFYNEPYSVLVRTVHSVLNTVDSRLLKEIILVDDSSSNTVLKGKLDYYVQTRLPANVVKIIRLKHRYVNWFVNRENTTIYTRTRSHHSNQPETTFISLLFGFWLRFQFFSRYRALSRFIWIVPKKYGHNLAKKSTYKLLRIRYFV